MTKSLALVLFAELLLAIFLAHSGCFYSQKLNRAYLTWYETRTPESRVAFDRQKRIEEYYRLGISAVFFGGMAGITLVGVQVFRRRHPSETQGSTDAPAAHDHPPGRP